MLKFVYVLMGHMAYCMNKLLTYFTYLHYINKAHVFFFYFSLQYEDVEAKFDPQNLIRKVFFLKKHCTHC